jgi:hypothetical protein
MNKKLILFRQKAQKVYMLQSMKFQTRVRLMSATLTVKDHPPKEKGDIKCDIQSSIDKKRICSDTKSIKFDEEITRR